MTGSRFGDAVCGGRRRGIADLFPNAGGGIGLMGEAGAEAILPLKRGPDGALGVASQGGGQPVT